MWAIWTLSVTFIAATVYSPVVKGACPSGWIGHDDSCYIINFLHQQTWSQSQHSCQSIGANLIQIDTPEENSFIQKQLAIQQPGSEWQFWTGGNDLKAEGEWQWAGSQQVFDFTDWYPGEPNHFSFGDEDCVTLYTRFHFKWNDDYCDKAFPFICEKRNDATNNVAVG